MPHPGPEQSAAMRRCDVHAVGAGPTRAWIRSFPLAAICIVAAASAASGQARRPRPTAQGVVFRSGAWVVRRSLDPTTSAPSCRTEPLRTRRIVRRAATPGGAAETVDQVALRAGPNGFVFLVNLDTDLSAYSLRFGNEPALPTQLPTAEERRQSAIVIEGDNFLHLLAVTRLRVQVLQRESGRVTTDDIDLRGLARAFQFGQTSAKCQAGH